MRIEQTLFAAVDTGGTDGHRDRRYPPVTMLLVLISCLVFVACGGTDGGDENSGENEQEKSVENLPYARNVIAFVPGNGGGYGEDSLPGVVLGPPGSSGTSQGSKTVLSLGDGGVIEVGFGDNRIKDGPGADFIVFENPFYIGGDATNPYQELGRVEVSQTGETWHAFPCKPDQGMAGEYPGCAGWRPVTGYDPFEIVPPSPSKTGGDPFDLADVGLESASYVRVVGISDRGTAPKIGFDLDAVGIVHPEAPN